MFSKQCARRNNGLKCISACGHCHGVECTYADATTTTISLSPTDDATVNIDETDTTNVALDDELLVDTEEDECEDADDGTGCEFFSDSQFEAELAMAIAEEIA